MTREIMKIITQEDMKSKIPIGLADGHLILHLLQRQIMLQTDVKLLPRPPIGPPPVHVRPLEFDCLTALHDNLTQNYFFLVGMCIFVFVCLFVRSQACVCLFVCA